MRLLRRLGSASLLARFAVLSLVLTIAVGAVLATVLEDAIAERAREQAEASAVVSVRLGLQPQLTPGDLARGFDPERLATVEAAVDNAADNPGGGASTTSTRSS